MHFANDWKTAFPIQNFPQSKIVSDKTFFEKEEICRFELILAGLFVTEMRRAHFVPACFCKRRWLIMGIEHILSASSTFSIHFVITKKEETYQNYLHFKDPWNSWKIFCWFFQSSFVFFFQRMQPIVWFLVMLHETKNRLPVRSEKVSAKFSAVPDVIRKMVIGMKWRSVMTVHTKLISVWKHSNIFPTQFHNSRNCCSLSSIRFVWNEMNRRVRIALVPVLQANLETNGHPLSISP